MPQADKTDLIAGAVVLALGAFFAFNSLDYRMGTVVRMGPGYVPFSLGIIGMILGAAIMVTALGRSGHLEAFMPKMVLPILGAILAFALILPRAGLIPATFVSVLLSTLSSPSSRLKTTLVLAAVTCLAIWAAFILLLGLPIPVIRNPF